MSNTMTYTRSQTSTYTESRANYIMGKVYEDLLGLTFASLVTKERAESLKSMILYLLNKKALKYFQLQFKKPNGTEIGGLHYELKSDGNIHSDENTGGLNYWGLPKDTRVVLLADLDYSSTHIEEVKKQTEAWGWGTGNALSGTQEYLKSYSKENYGFKQSKIGQW